MKQKSLIPTFPFLLLALIANACAPGANAVGADTAAQSPLRTDFTGGVEFLSAGKCRAVITQVEESTPRKGFTVIYDPRCNSADRLDVLKSSKIAGKFFVNGLSSNFDAGGPANISRFTCAGFGPKGFRHITAHTLEELYAKQKTVEQDLGPNTRWTTPEDCQGAGSGELPPI